MYREFYAGMEWAALPVVALLFFLAAFGLVVLRTFGTHREHDFDAAAALPLADGMTTNAVPRPGQGAEEKDEVQP